MLVLFWVAWVLMFLAAVLLIIYSPKCATLREPEWWRRHVSYQVSSSFLYFILLLIKYAYIKDASQT